MKRLEYNIYILDSNENLKESLRPQAFERKRQIGSSDIIQFETDQSIDKNDRLIWRDSRGKWHEYIVRGMDGEHDVRGVTKVYYAESSIYELVGDWIGNLWTNVDDSTALDALTMVLTDTEHGHRRTRWDVGNVPATDAKELNFKETTAYDALKTICETFNLELETEVIVSGNKIIKRNIHLMEQRGADYGKRFTWRKDLTSVERRVIQEDVITALKGYGKPDMIWDGHPVRLTFETVNPTGLDYVYSNESRDRWGRLNADGTRSHFYGAVEFNDVTDPWELLEKTEEHFEKVSVPQVEYEAQVEDMTRAGWDHEGVDLGDLVLVIDEELDVRIKARVMELTQDVEGYATKILIGNFRESWNRAQAQTTKAVSAWRSKVGVWDRASSINPDGTVNADIVEGIKESWEQDMNAGLFVGEIETMPGGFRFINEDQSWATEIGVMGIRIADTKLPNGEWNFTSFMTGKGFAADSIHGNSIIGGTITGDHIAAGSIDANKITIGGNRLDDKLTETDALQAELQQAVQVGGRNVLTTFPYDFTVENANYKVVLEDGVYKWTQKTTVMEGFDIPSFAPNRVADYVFSMKSSHDQFIRNRLLSSGAVRSGDLTIVDKGDHYFISFQLHDFNPRDYIYFYGTDLYSPIQEVHFWDLKLELGTMPTAYSRAPEDIMWELGDIMWELDDLRYELEAIELTPGADGKSSYLHIAYADSSTGAGMDTNPAGKKYVGHAVTETDTRPTDPSLFTWSKYVGEDGAKGDKGEQGVPGIPGTPGKDGSERWIWIRYAEDAMGNGMSDYPGGKDFIGVSGNQTTPDESDDPTDYVWSRINDHSRLDELGQLQEELQQAVQGGGRNLLFQSQDVWETDQITGGSAYGVYRIGQELTDLYESLLDKEATVSYEVFIENSVDENTSVRSYGVNGNPKYSMPVYSHLGVPTNQWVRLSRPADIRLTPDRTGQSRLEFYGAQIANNTKIRVRKVKFELGTIPTAYTRAPEDIEADIANARLEAANALDSYATTVTSKLTDLQGQVDGSISTWFFDVPPDINLPPSSDWQSVDEMNRHLGDLYYDRITGYVYRWRLHAGNYAWERITDTDVTKALADASKAQDTADSKRRVFWTEPQPPYDRGDLWTQGTDGDLMRAIAGRQTGAHQASDWVKAVKYTDDSAAQAVADRAATLEELTEELQNAVQGGGRNLALDSLEPRTGDQYLLTIIHLSQPMIPGDKYRITLNGTKDEAVSFRLWQNDTTNQDIVLEEISPNLWTGVFTAINYRVEPTQLERLRIYQWPATSDIETAVIEKIMITKGTHLHDYTRAPEDIEADILEAQTKANDAIQLANTNKTTIDSHGITITRLEGSVQSGGQNLILNSDFNTEEWWTIGRK